MQGLNETPNGIIASVWLAPFGFRIYLLFWNGRPGVRPSSAAAHRARHAGSPRHLSDHCSRPRGRAAPRCLPTREILSLTHPHTSTIRYVFRCLPFWPVERLYTFLVLLYVECFFVQSAQSPHLWAVGYCGTYVLFIGKGNYLVSICLDYRPLGN